MRGRTIKNNEPKTLKDHANTSTIKKYLTKEGSPKSPVPDKSGPEKQKQGNKDKKKAPGKKKGELLDQPKEDISISTESEFDRSKMEEQGTGAQLPTKMEMVDMFLRLETFIKTEFTALQTDLGHLLTRVEETEEKTEKLEN